MKVEQFLHSNQFHLYERKEDCNIDCLQSYNSLVVKIETNNKNYKKTIVLGRDWDYSKTTSAHVYQFLEQYGGIYIPYNETNKRKYIQKLIDNGEIVYDENMF